MGGVFGVVGKSDCVLDLFFGVDYHSHLGNKRGGMAVSDGKYFHRTIHNIENSPFRTKFERDLDELHGHIGIGCISDTDPQPLLIQSHLGSFAITTVGKISNKEELIRNIYRDSSIHFLEQSRGKVNISELVAVLINQKSSFEEGIKYAMDLIEGSMTLLVLTHRGLYAARDRYGRTPLVLGKRADSVCVTLESHAFMNLGYKKFRELGPSEIVFIEEDSVTTVNMPTEDLRICTFMWVYYGYPTAEYEGINVECMRYRCGGLLAKRDDVCADIVAGVPDSGIAHAIGYSNASGIPFARPFIKYTPTWPRSFMPSGQNQRDMVAKMKLIPVENLIVDKDMILIDDSIVRGTQLRDTADFLYSTGAKHVHVRPACPPILFGCKYLNFTRSTSDMELIARRIIREREGEEVSADLLSDYANPDSENYKNMVEDIRKLQHFTTLRFHRMDDLVESVGLPKNKLCTYCWNGKEKND